MRHYGTAPRISIFTCILLAALDLTAVCRAQIDKFPHGAITLVAPYPPGGTVDAPVGSSLTSSANNSEHRSSSRTGRAPVETWEFRASHMRRQTVTLS
jgi:hypothetical protein